jgi:hypothetical protein
MLRRARKVLIFDSNASSLMLLSSHPLSAQLGVPLLSLQGICTVHMFHTLSHTVVDILQARKNAKAAGQAFYDVNVLQALAGTLGSALPESLRPRSCALSPHQVWHHGSAGATTQHTCCCPWPVSV